MMTTKWQCQHDLLLICCLFQNKKEIFDEEQVVCLAYFLPAMLATHVVQFAYSFDDDNFMKKFLFEKLIFQIVLISTDVYADKIFDFFSTLWSMVYTTKGNNHIWMFVTKKSSFTKKLGSSGDETNFIWSGKIFEWFITWLKVQKSSRF